MVVLWLWPVGVVSNKSKCVSQLTSVFGLFYHDIETFVISYLIIPVQIKWLSVPFLLCRLSSPLLLFYGIEIGSTSKDLFQIFCPYFLCCLFFIYFKLASGVAHPPNLKVWAADMKCYLCPLSQIIKINKQKADISLYTHNYINFKFY